MTRQKSTRTRLAAVEDANALQEMAEETWAIADEVLDETGTACDGCGGFRFANYREKMLGRKIRAAANKLAALAEELGDHILDGHPTEKE